jgi:hypothetical protein
MPCIVSDFGLLGVILIFAIASKSLAAIHLTFLLLGVLCG